VCDRKERQLRINLARRAGTRVDHTLCELSDARAGQTFTRVQCWDAHADIGFDESQPVVLTVELQNYRHRTFRSVAYTRSVGRCVNTN
jgi:hypothetical protein